MGMKDGSQLKEKLAVKVWKVGQPNKFNYGCKKKEKEDGEEWKKREQKNKEKQGKNQ